MIPYFYKFNESLLMINYSFTHVLFTNSFTSKQLLRNDWKKVNMLIEGSPAISRDAWNRVDSLACSHAWRGLNFKLSSVYSYQSNQNTGSCMALKPGTSACLGSHQDADVWCGGACLKLLLMYVMIMVSEEGLGKEIFFQILSGMQH